MFAFMPLMDALDANYSFVNQDVSDLFYSKGYDPNILTFEPVRLLSTFSTKDWTAQRVFAHRDLFVTSGGTFGVLSFSVQMLRGVIDGHTKDYYISKATNPLVLVASLSVASLFIYFPGTESTVLASYVRMFLSLYLCFLMLIFVLAAVDANGDAIPFSVRTPWMLHVQIACMTFGIVSVIVNLLSAAFLLGEKRIANIIDGTPWHYIFRGLRICNVIPRIPYFVYRFVVYLMHATPIHYEMVASEATEAAAVEEGDGSQALGFVDLAKELDLFARFYCTIGFALAMYVLFVRDYAPLSMQA